MNCQARVRRLRLFTGDPLVVTTVEVLLVMGALADMVLKAWASVSQVQILYLLLINKLCGLRQASSYPQPHALLYGNHSHDAL